MKTLLINDKLYWSFNNWTLLQFCFLSYIENIPRFCYHEQLTVAGNCRMCLIEDLKSLKPMVACTLIPNDGGVFFTNSLKVKKAREAMLEFLLINHPLDCPICCQGGECDLQDLTEMIGADHGRFYDTKRAILDKNLGPIIKTSMNRCIHCTRCIRFSIEILHSSHLGILGRGNTMEIGTYLDFFLNHEFQGNLIDICPVGALTSKLYAYTSRSWECEYYLLPNIFNKFLDNIRIEIRGNKIMRILPVYNLFWKNEWLSDFDRYITEKIFVSRIKTPLFKLQFFFLRCSWLNIYYLIKAFFINSIKWLLLNKLKYIEVNCFYNSLISYSSYNLLLMFLKQLSLVNSRVHPSANVNLRLLKTQIKDLFISYCESYIFLFVQHFRYLYPQLYINIISQLAISSTLKHLFSLDTTCSFSQMSNINLQQFTLFIKGKHNLSLFITKDKVIIFSMMFNQLLQEWNIRLKALHSQLKVSLYNISDYNSSTFLLNYNYSNTLKVIYNIEDLNLYITNSSKVMYIYQNSFINQNLEFATIILPTTFGYEEVLSTNKLLTQTTNIYLLSNNQTKQIKKIIWNNNNLKNTEDCLNLFQIYIEFFNNQNSTNYYYIFKNVFKYNDNLKINKLIIFLSLWQHFTLMLIRTIEQSDVLKFLFNNLYNNYWLNLQD